MQEHKSKRLLRQALMKNMPVLFFLQPCRIIWIPAGPSCSSPCQWAVDETSLQADPCLFCLSGQMKAAAFSPRWMRDTGVHPQGQQAPAENAASPWSGISWDHTAAPTAVAFYDQKRGQQTTVGSLWSQLQTNKLSTFLGIPSKDSKWCQQASPAQFEGGWRRQLKEEQEDAGQL